MSEQLPLWVDDITEPDDFINGPEDDNEPRCNVCGVILDDPNLVMIGYCSSECERENINV